ncbi:MAG: flagellar biosynthesis protein FlhF [Salinispira sp.]
MSYDYFIETAISHRDAEELVLQKYGERATITTRRQIQKGGILGFGRKEFVEVSGYISREPIRRPIQPMVSRQSHAPSSALGNGAPDFDRAKQEILKIAGQNESSTMNKILVELRDLKGDVQKARDEDTRQTDQPPSIQEITAIMEENDFSSAYTQHILKKCRGLSIDELDDRDAVQQKVLHWIADTVCIQEDIPRAHPRVIALVGPTGVGKTTSIAKLAGLYCTGKFDGKKRSVRIIATDHFRIGALKQIEIYAEIMKIPLESAATPEELEKSLAICQDADMIFIDTPGRSPRDFENIAKLNSFLHVCGSKLEVFLTMSANVKFSDTKRIIQQFEQFNFSSLIITKTDESESLGTIMSILWEKQKKAGFITCGQRVPNDLQFASQQHFLNSLSGFSVRWNEEESHKELPT